VPDEDLGEAVKAVVQPMPGVQPGPELVEELIAFCGAHLSRQKVPRSIDFEDELPRLPSLFAWHISPPRPRLRNLELRRGTPMPIELSINLEEKRWA
jgi:hypothetical protein